ncbi:uncharacterized protein LOC119079843 [Bradysia coprophila]|uniref:uncharacterized protein LOC119079843 n=1 Tax=Bradysia coprophila TaxID=38358 RepID=UPI00187DBF8D|nr:uncharacterized protein LOC119079843 [Bradysia coprophila]
MKISKNHLLLLLHILQIDSGQFAENSRIFQINVEDTPLNPCRFNSDCEIQCLDGNFSTDAYIESINSTYFDNDECHSTGVKLIIPTTYFTDKTLKSKWLPVDINIIDLDVDFNKTCVFQQNAFVGKQFLSVKKSIA